jgi:hypothetical protein
VSISRIQAASGGANWNRVYNLETALVADQDTFAATQGQLSNSLISTYKAIGGGWEIRYGIRRGSMVDMTQPMEAAEELPAVPVQEGPELEKDELPPVPTDDI